MTSRYTILIIINSSSSSTTIDSISVRVYRSDISSCQLIRR